MAARPKGGAAQRLTASDGPAARCERLIKTRLNPVRRTAGSRARRRSAPLGMVGGPEAEPQPSVDEPAAPAAPGADVEEDVRHGTGRSAEKEGARRQGGRAPGCRERAAPWRRGCRERAARVCAATKPARPAGHGCRNLKAVKFFRWDPRAAHTRRRCTMRHKMPTKRAHFRSAATINPAPESSKNPAPDRR